MILLTYEAASVVIIHWPEAENYNIHVEIQQKVHVQSCNDMEQYISTLKYANKQAPVYKKRQGIAGICIPPFPTKYPSRSNC